MTGFDPFMEASDPGAQRPLDLERQDVERMAGAVVDLELEAPPFGAVRVVLGRQVAKAEGRADEELMERAGGHGHGGEGGHPDGHPVEERFPHRDSLGSVLSTSILGDGAGWRHGAAPLCAAGLALALLLPGCSTVRHYGEAAAAARREQNDLQARGTMAAVCDIAIASYLRELDARERQGVTLICPPADAAAGLPELLVAPEG